jgi:hypothetical protein
VTPDSINVYWFVLPLALAISLVYAASRHESWKRIAWHSGRLCATILGLMAVTTFLLVLLHRRG